MKHKGSCHCKKVTYEVETNLENVISCNCSHCHAKGLILNFVSKDKFNLLSGEDNLITYLFNKKSIDHLFCKTCGVQSFCKGQDKNGNETFAINVRCLENVDITKLKLTEVDGKSW